MCNRIHRESMESIQSFGMGYKLFNGNRENPLWVMAPHGNVEIGKWYDFEILKLAESVSSKDEKDYGFCFFTSFEEAKRVAVIWYEQTSEPLWIAEIDYEQGIARFIESLMISHSDVTAAICKRFKIRNAIWGGIVK